MKTRTKILSILMATVMMFTSFSAISVTANAASVAKTSISKLEAKKAGFKVTIKKAKKVTGYQIQYSTSSKMKSAKSVKTTKTSKTVSNLKSGKKYYVRVRCYKKSNKKTNYSSWSKTKSISVAVTANAASKPAATTITSLKAKPAEFTVKWKKKGTPKYYQIQYSTNKKFTKKTVETVKQPYYENVRTFRNLKEGKKYYVRVRYKKGKVYSSWSKVKSVTTKKHTSGYKLGRYTDEDNDDGYNDARNQAKAVIATLGITDSMSDLEKVARVQNWINHNWYYSKDFNVYPYGEYNFMFYVGKGACGQFAEHFIVFMDELNIPCEMVYRSEKLGAVSDHFWNIIKVDGYWWTYDCESFSDKSEYSYCNYKNGNNFTFYTFDYSDNVTKSLWNSCQPHGEDISYDSTYNMNQQLNSIVDSLN